MPQFGPIDVQVVAFPGSKFTGAIAPALRKVVEKGTINIVDLAFITKGEDGSIAIIELSDLSSEAKIELDEAIEDVLDLLNDDDLMLIADSLEPGSSAVAIVIEHAWARDLSSAIAGSDGHVVLSERIPREIVEAAVAAIA
ncbi:MAG: DUF6325 family protein [Candidatus Nanopelagicales bacterium]